MIYPTRSWDLQPKADAPSLRIGDMCVLWFALGALLGIVLAGLVWQ